MTGKIAIFCPNIGGQSESFIRRHIEYVDPGRLVIITNNILPEADRSWDVNCPVYLAKKPDTLMAKLDSLIRRKMKVGLAPYVNIEGAMAFLRQHNVTVLWGHYLNRSWPLIRVAEQTGIPFFVHALGYDLSSFFRKTKWRKRYTDYRHAAGVIVLNRVMKERMISLGVSEERVHIIPCGVDIPKQPTRKTDSETVRCLAVGRMVSKKAPVKLIEAFRLALQQQPNLHLDVVGEGPLLKKAQAHAKTHGMHQHVTFHGGQPHQKVIELIQRSDLFLQHSIVDPRTGDEEGMPVVILEAMAAGLPVVSTNHAGIPEAVLDSKSGYIVEEGDVDGMARRISELADDPEQRSKMGEYGRDIIQSRFTCLIEKQKLQNLIGKF